MSLAMVLNIIYIDNIDDNIDDILKGTEVN